MISIFAYYQRRRAPGYSAFYWCNKVRRIYECRRYLAPFCIKSFFRFIRMSLVVIKWKFKFSITLLSIVMVWFRWNFRRKIYAFVIVRPLYFMPLLRGYPHVCTNGGANWSYIFDGSLLTRWWRWSGWILLFLQRVMIKGMKKGIVYVLWKTWDDFSVYWFCWLFQ